MTCTAYYVDANLADEDREGMIYIIQVLRDNQNSKIIFVEARRTHNKSDTTKIMSSIPIPANISYHRAQAAAPTLVDVNPEARHLRQVCGTCEVE